MTCPKCHAEVPQSEVPHSEFETGDRTCPECGIRLLRNVSGVMKTSAVLIAAGGERGFYHSVQDVPEPLRTRLLETTSSSNSGTIVIADRAGKAQLTQVMARRDAVREETPLPRSRELQPQVPSAPVDSAALSAMARLPWLPWGGFVLVLILAAIIFAIFHTDRAIFRFH